MKILAIETSCDDTCVAVIKASSDNKKIFFSVLSNIVSSQTEIHKRWGGIYPTIARREHQRNIIPVFKKALKDADLLKLNTFSGSKLLLNKKYQYLEKIFNRDPNLFKKLVLFLKRYQKPNIDAISVTVGPGLEPSLWVGVNFAKSLSCFWDIPIIPVNHIEGHILANLLPQIRENAKRKTQKAKQQLKTQNFKKIKFPAICLVVSGGHTQLILTQKIGKYTILGETRDDAAGECFDKTARILGIGYPGGPLIEKEAEKLDVANDELQIKLPRPMIYQKNYDFSFSGLKTAVLYDFKNRSAKIRKSKKYIQTISAEIQQSIIDVLIKKTIKAAKEYNVKSIILGGGVTANKELRYQFQQKIKRDIPNVKFQIPDSKFCTDNAAMIGVAGYFNRGKSIKNWQKINVNANLEI